MHIVFMKTMTIRNVPDEVYEVLVKTAKEEHRSLQEQVRYTLANDVALRNGSVCEPIAEYRAKLANRKTKHTVVDDIRRDRER